MASSQARFLLNGALWLAYPVIVFCGLRWGSPRVVALLLLAVMVLRRRQDARRFLGELGRIDHAVIAALIGLAVVAAWTNSELLVRLFPCAMNLGFLVLFARSLTTPQSMIERFARLREPELSADGVQYTRRVTQVWCGFLALNTLASLWTAFMSSRDWWAWYNGLITYVLMGALFAGEWLYRTYRLKHIQPPSPT
jgi:uncharacterized membrane protein